MFISTTKLKIKYKGGSPGHWLSEETLNQKVVSLNPGAGYWKDIFSHLYVLRIVMFVWKDENKRKRGQGWPIFLEKDQI